MYKDLMKIVKEGDVVLTFNVNKRLSGIIANITDSEWSHTMLYVGNGFVVESSVGGTQITPIKKYCKGEHNILVLAPKIQKEEKRLIIEASLELLGKKYGYLQLFWYMFLRLIGKSENPKWQLDIQPRALVCSEAIAKAFNQIDIPIKKGYKDHGIEPIDFIESDIFYEKYRYIVDAPE